MKTQRSVILLLLCMSALIVSCSRGHSSAIVPSVISGTDNNLVAEYSENNTPRDFGLFGTYKLHLDYENQTGELIPDRSMMFGESFLVNGISYFQMQPCATCLNISGIGLTSDHLLKVTFSVDHPMDKGTSSEPPSGSNRLDLDIFDLILIIEPPFGNQSFYPHLGDFGVYINDKICAYADGYTYETSIITYKPASNPYYLVVDCTDPGMPWYNKLEMGTRKQEFNTYFRSGYENFTLYLTFGYGLSVTSFDDRLSPTYFNPEFNRKAAWKVDVLPPNGTMPPVMENTWNDQDTETPFYVTVNIYDWQQVARVSGQFPDVGHPHHILSDSVVESVSVEIPGMTDTYKMVMDPKTGSGSPSDPLVARIPFPNENQLPCGEYPGLVEVVDSRISALAGIPGQSGSMVNCPDGVNLEWYKPGKFKTYQTFTATVVEYEPFTCHGAETIFYDISVSGSVDDQANKWYLCYLPTAGIDSPSSISISPSSGSLDIYVYGIEPGEICPGALLGYAGEVTSNAGINLEASEYSCIFVKVHGNESNTSFELDVDLKPALTNVSVELYVATDDGTATGNWPVYESNALYHDHIVQMITWANIIWNKYGYNLDWDETEEIISAQYYVLESFDESQQMHARYGQGTGKLSLYFTQELPDWVNTAYCTYQWSELDHNIDSVYSVYAPTVMNWQSVVAHEHGHAFGRLMDQYLYYWFFSACPCGDESCLEDWLGFPVYLYSDSESCYDGNLMWFAMGWSANSYDLKEGQVNHTNWFNFNYPENFPMN